MLVGWTKSKEASQFNAVFTSIINSIQVFSFSKDFTCAHFLAVHPDAPVALNWTHLNVSPSGLSYDVRVNWLPPPSADVGVGWMRLEYEIQYREGNTTNWEAVSVLSFEFPLLLSCSYTHRHTHSWHM